MSQTWYNIHLQLFTQYLNVRYWTSTPIWAVFLSILDNIGQRKQMTHAAFGVTVIAPQNELENRVHGNINLAIHFGDIIFNVCKRLMDKNKKMDDVLHF